MPLRDARIDCPVSLRNRLCHSFPVANFAFQYITQIPYIFPSVTSATSTARVTVSSFPKLDILCTSEMHEGKICLRRIENIPELFTHKMEFKVIDNPPLLSQKRLSSLCELYYPPETVPKRHSDSETVC